MGNSLTWATRPMKETLVRNKKECVVVILALLFSTAVSNGVEVGHEEPSRVTFCDVTSAAQKYDNTAVVLQALIQSSGHEVHVRSPKCPSTTTDDRSSSIELPNGWNSTKLGKKLSSALQRDRAADVTFEALFQSSRAPYGPEGTRFHFVLRRLISVKTLPSRDTRRSK